MENTRVQNFGFVAYFSNKLRGGDLPLPPMVGCQTTSSKRGFKFYCLKQFWEQVKRAICKRFTANAMRLPSMQYKTNAAQNFETKTVFCIIL